MKNMFKCLILILFLLLPNSVYAANPVFTVRPGSGNVILKKNFVVDILIDTKGSNVVLARAVLKFDPSRLQVVKATRNESLFCTYPADEQSIDNENGTLMITGFCQSGVDQPYKTSGSADVLARVTFKAMKSGNAKLEWQYSGEDEPFKSVIMKDGSPPTNLLKSKPANPAFIVGSTSGNSGNNSNGGNTPNTGFGISAGLVVAGISLVILGFAYTKWSDNRLKSKLKTVVDYGDKSSGN